MKKVVKLSLLLVLAVLGTVVFIQCQKEGSITPTGKSSSAVVKDNQRTSSSWTYGEPKWYDDAGLPRWSEEYPRIVLTNRTSNSGNKIAYYFYSFNDYLNLTEKQNGCRILDWQGKYTQGDQDSWGKCDGTGCDCFPEVIITPTEKVIPEGSWTIIIRHEKDGLPL